jgi:hypothetical protein
MANKRARDVLILRGRTIELKLAHVRDPRFGVCPQYER